jgi:hypothetical protein
MKILHLTLKKKWFDMILSGEKKEEYRECKDYWLKRLSDFFICGPYPFEYYQYDAVSFRHGYAKDAPEILVKCIRVGEGIPRPEWSDNAKGTHIIIFLGDILSTKNING